MPLYTMIVTIVVFIFVVFGEWSDPKSFPKKYETKNLTKKPRIRITSNQDRD